MAIQRSRVNTIASLGVGFLLGGIVGSYQATTFEAQALEELVLFSEANFAATHVVIDHYTILREEFDKLYFVYENNLSECQRLLTDYTVLKESI